MALFSKYVPFKEDLNRYLTNCRKVFAEIGDRQSAALVDGFLQDFGQQRFNITIMGSLKRGKSTLLNTMMERADDDISPIASEVCTSAIVKYLDKDIADDSTKEHAVVYFNDDGKEPLSIPLSRLRDYVTEARNPENKKGVRSVYVYGDFPEWSKAVTIVDSPGQNAVYDYHDTLLQDFLPYTDAIIFLIAADLPIDGGDFKLLHELLSKDEQKKLFFVITKSDRVEEEEDLDAVKDRVKDILTQVGIPFDKVYCTAAKPVFERLCEKCTKDELENEKHKNGILELEEDLEEFIVKKSRETEVFASRVRMILEKTAAACSRYVDTSKIMLSRMEVDVGTLQLEETALIDKNEELRRKLKESLRKFDRDWAREVSKVERRFATKADRVTDKIIDEIGKRGGLLDKIATSFSLKRRIQKALSTEIQDVVLELEGKLDEIVRTLDKEYCDGVEFYFRRPKGNGDVVGGAAGIFSGAALAGTAAWGVSAATGPVIAAQAAFSAWSASNVAASTAVIGTTVRNAGLFRWIWHWVAGQPEAVILAQTAEKSAAGAAVGAGVVAIFNVGISIIVTFLAKKILTMGLGKINEMRVSGIVESALSEMEKCLCASLEKYRKSISDEYTRSIEDVILDNTDRLEEVHKLMAKDDPEERARITKKLETVQRLLGDCVHVQKQLPLL